MDSVPDEMADAAAQMQEKGEGASEQHDLAERGSDHALHGGVGFGPRGGRAQPHDQSDSAQTQNHAGDTVGDRQDRGELRPIDLDIGRERPGLRR